MATASVERRPRCLAAFLASVGLLGACGGGAEILAVIQIVTPLAGQWANSNDEALLLSAPSKETETMSASYSLTGSVNSLSGVCGDTSGGGAAVEGTLDNGKLTLRVAGSPANAAPCLQGEFKSLVRLEVAADATHPQRDYLNNRVEVAMDTGLWSTGDGRVKLKFSTPTSVNNDEAVEPVLGCDVSTAGSPVNFTGTMAGFDTVAGKNPSIDSLDNAVSGIPLYTQVEFVHGDTLTLRNAAGSALTLKRRPDTANTVCPP